MVPFWVPNFMRQWYPNMDPNFDKYPYVYIFTYICACVCLRLSLDVRVLEGWGFKPSEELYHQ